MHDFLHNVTLGDVTTGTIRVNLPLNMTYGRLSLGTHPRRPAKTTSCTQCMLPRSIMSTLVVPLRYTKVCLVILTMQLHDRLPLCATLPTIVSWDTLTPWWRRCISIIIVLQQWGTRSMSSSNAQLKYSIMWTMTMTFFGKPENWWISSLGVSINITHNKVFTPYQ